MRVAEAEVARIPEQRAVPVVPVAAAKARGVARQGPLQQALEVAAAAQVS